MTPEGVFSAGDPRPATVVTVPTNLGSDPERQTGSGVALSQIAER
jgi:hypothetical protein